MGTNYYHKIDGIETSEAKHIGKSSGGWCFALHVYPEEGISNLEDWRKALGYGGIGTIYDEYGSPITFNELMNIITNRSWHTLIDDNPKVDSYYNGVNDFLKRNHAVRGPNNLLRCEIGEYCIGHEGTCDYIIGEFS